MCSCQIPSLPPLAIFNWPIDNHPHILPVDTSSTVGIGVTTKMPKTRDNSSLFAHTSAGPVVVMGPAVPVDGGTMGSVCPPQIPLSHRHPGHRLERWTEEGTQHCICISWWPCDQVSIWSQHGCCSRSMQQSSAWLDTPLVPP